MIEAVLRAIDYIERNLDGELALDHVANAAYYSKYHLHRIFADLVGFSVHSYIRRRRLTEAAKLLVTTAMPILDIAITAGYESQQSFSKVFKAMYKQTPQGFRQNCAFYPLQLPLSLAGHSVLLDRDAACGVVGLAVESDIPAWMELVRLVVDGFPFLQEDAYQAAVKRYIRERRALIMKHHGIATGILLFGDATIDFLALHPFYRKQSMTAAFLRKAAAYLPANSLSTTTYRAGDAADTGYRRVLLHLGFQPGELLEEFGYPTQRFVLPTLKTA